MHRLSLVLIALCLVLPVAAWSLGGAGLWWLHLAGYLAAALAVGVLVTQGPQVWRACRERDLSGLSPATWGLSILDAAAWGAYGVAADDAALIGYAVVLSSSAVVVLTRIRWTRSQARSDGAKRRTTSSAMT